MLQTENISTREAGLEDIDEITLLINELGYPSLVEEVQIRLKNIFAHPDYKTIVAELNNQIVGMAGLYKGIYYEKNGMYMRILAFVVKQSSRKQGIGKVLMMASEDWAKQHGLKTILISSGNRAERTAAHAFYKKMGYAIKSSGFVKEL